jgi:4-hydroxy-tetrahydrodipicolinate reductase
VAPIKVVVTGASGKMSRETLAALTRDPAFDPAGAVSRATREEYLSLPNGAGLIPYSSDLGAMLTRVRPDVMVDFTNAGVALDYARTAFAHGVRPVIGTSALDDRQVAEIRSLAEQHRLGAIIAPNFALGAVLMQLMARTAARYYDHAEVIEFHHDGKKDSPSGTAVATARLMREARGRDFTRPESEREAVAGARAANHGGIGLHSVRLPGLVAHQEVIFGGPGETLTIRHDSIDRVSFMPGVLLAVRAVRNLDHLVVGLESILLEGAS